MGERANQILVVDDDASIRRLVVAILTRAQLPVDSARDGVEALEKIDDTDFGLILLDLMMPRLDGFGVLHRLKDCRPDLLDRVVVMTAATDRVVESIDQSAICGVVRKPFDVATFVDFIRSCLDAASIS